MRNIAKFILPLLVLALGVPLMMTLSSLVSSNRLAPVSTLGAFVVYNFLCAYLTGMNTTLKAAWSIKKIWHFIPGFLVGLIPIGASYFWLHQQDSLPPYVGVTAIGSVLTLVTITWEELWFRGIALEMGGQRYSKIGAALIFGIVFALLHLMNPKIDLFIDGPQLVLAGYALTVCYFVFGSIWSTLGMHFANNWVQAAFGSSKEPHTIMYTGPLVVIAIVLTIKLAQKTHKGQERVF